MSEAIAYSVLKPSAILEEARPRYAWPEKARLGLKHTGTDTLYTVIISDEIFLLRIYSAHREAEAIAAELSLLLNFSRAGLSVPEPLPTVDGTLSWRIHAPEGPRAVVLFRYIIGHSPGWRMTPYEAKSFGESTAKFHSVADQIDEPWSRFRHDESYFLKQGLPDLLERSSAGSRPILEGTVELLQHAVRRFNSSSEMNTGICHGDLHKQNFVIDNRTQAILIDFGCCGHGWRAYDIATPRWSIQAIDTEQSHRDALYRAFLEGYNHVKVLSDADLEAVPYFFAARHLWYMEVLLRRALLGIGTWYPLTDRWFDEESDWLRSWLSENL